MSKSEVKPLVAFILGVVKIVLAFLRQSVVSNRQVRHETYLFSHCIPLLGPGLILPHVIELGGDEKSYGEDVDDEQIGISTMI